MSDLTTTRRIARKRHKCGCGELIEPGDAYLVHKAFPGHDSGYADHAGHPVTMAECIDCVIRYGREHLIQPVPDHQPYRYWLGDTPPPFDSPVGSDR